MKDYLTKEEIAKILEEPKCHWEVMIKELCRKKGIDYAKVKPPLENRQEEMKL